MRKFLWIAALLAAQPAAASDDVSDLLKRQTQELFDAVSAGDATIWDKYLDADALVADENGAVTNKKDTVAQVTPLPKGISGTIMVTQWQAHRHGAVAVTAFVADEHEDFHGQHLHALYLTTTTWLSEPDGWKVVGQQTIALQQDPPAVQLPDTLLDEYVGHYKAAPDLVYEIARSDGGLSGGTVGGKAVALKTELRDVLFTPGQPRTRKIFTRDASGHVDGFVSRREGRDVVWTKIF